MKKEDQRDYLLDNYKTLLIFLIVIGHFIEQSYDSNIFLQYLKLGIYAFHVPAFVFVSGYFSKRNDSIKNLVGKILIPYVIYEVIYYLFYTYFLQIETKLYMIYPKFSLWYLLCLFGWRVMALRIKKSAICFALSLAAGVLIGLSSLDNFLSLPRMVFFFPFFLAGRWMTKEQIVVLRKERWRIFCIIAVAVTFGVLFLGNHLFTISPKLFYGRYDYEFLGQGNGIGILCRLGGYAAAFLITLALLGVFSAKRQIWTYIGERTMGIYIFHGLVYNFFKEKTSLLNDLSSPAAGILLLIGCCGLTLLLSLSPFARIAGGISGFGEKLINWIKIKKELKKEDLNMKFEYEANQITYYNEKDKAFAKVTFPAVDDDTVDVDHTFVSKSLRGRGVAGKLMEAVANQLRAQDKKALLTCSYARDWFERHPEFNDVVKEQAEEVHK